MKKLAFALSLAVGFLGTAAIAGDVKWTGASTVDATAWGDPDNWDVGVPDETSEVTIDTKLFTTSKVLKLGANRSVKKLTFSNNTAILIDGDGKYALLVGSEINTKSSSTYFKCDIVATNAVTLKCDSWGARFNPLGKISGTDFLTGVSQNSATTIMGDIALTGEYLINEYGTTLGPTVASVTLPDGTVLSEFGGSISAASVITVDNFRLPFSYQSGLIFQNQFAINGNRIADTIPIRFSGVGGSMLMVANSSETTSEQLGLLKLDGAPVKVDYQLAYYTYTAPTLAFSGIERSGCGYLMLNQEAGKNLSYLRIAGLANDGHGMIGPWAFSVNNNTPYFLTADETDAVGGPRVRTLAESEHLVLVESGNADTAPSMMTASELALAEDAAIWALTLKNSGDQTLALGDNDLSIGSGGLIFAGGGRKTISADSGVLRFGGEEIVLSTRNNGKTNVISAPIAWTAPAGSNRKYPNLIVANSNGNGTRMILSGADQIGDYGDLFIESSHDKSNAKFVFDGPSDRRFHGTFSGRFTVEKRGSGALELLGSAGAFQTSSKIEVKEGVLRVGIKGTPEITVDAGAELINLEDGEIKSVPTIASGGVLGGVGKLPSLGGNGAKKVLADGVIIRPGLDGMPGYLYNTGTFGPAGNFTLDIAVSETSNSLFQVKNEYMNATSKITIRLADHQRGAAKLTPERKLTVFKVTDQWTGESINYDNITVELENGSPKYLDLSNAVVEKKVTSKKIELSVSGLKTIPPGGLSIIVR